MHGSAIEHPNHLIQGNPFQVLFFVIKLEGCGVVLEAQWLKTSGPIVWHFMQLLHHVLGYSLLLVVHFKFNKNKLWRTTFSKSLYIIEE